MKAEEIKFSNIPDFQYFSNQSISNSNNTTSPESKILHIHGINVKKKFCTLLDIPRLDDWVNLMPNNRE
jgi:hypothetical protein